MPASRLVPLGGNRTERNGYFARGATRAGFPGWAAGEEHADETIEALLFEHGAFAGVGGAEGATSDQLGVLGGGGEEPS
jgi:hypothetical protein